VVGHLVTMDPGRPEAGAMAVADGRIVALGSPEELAGLRGPGTEVLALGDRVAYPGFVEAHMHLWTSALFDGFLDCSAYTHHSFEGVLAAIGEAASRAGPGEWVTGSAFDPSLYPGTPDLTAGLLDRVAPDIPVLVMNASLHFAYANSPALARAGLTDATPDPPGGRYLRTDGRLDGVVSEMSAIAPLVAALPPLSREALEANLVAVVRRAAAAGVTSLREAATGALLGGDEFRLLQQLSADGRLDARVTVAFVAAARRAVEAAGVAPGDGDDRVRAVAWKIIADGSNQGRSGYLREPYLGSEGRGHANLDARAMAEEVAYGHRHGWQVMTHANGDAAIDLALDAFEEVLDGGGTDRRHRIEHCSITDDGQLARMAALGLSPSFLIDHVAHWGRAFRDTIIGPDRAGRLDRMAAAVRNGLRPSLHSDYAVSPIDPLRAVRTAVTRVLDDGGDVLNPGERVDVGTALRAVTIDAAWQNHVDHLVGSLEPGKAADLVVLSGDPRRVEPSAVAALTVEETWLDGSPVHRAG
jgi:predicted amidohydrolase YtcJ